MAEEAKASVMGAHVDALINGFNGAPEPEAAEPVNEPPPAPEAKKPAEEVVPKKNYEHLQSVLDRQAAELGELRKLKARLETLEKTPANQESGKKNLDALISDPDKYIEKRMLEAELRRLEEAAKEEQAYMENESRFTQAVPDADDLVDDILMLAKEKAKIQGVTRKMWDETKRTDPGTAQLFALWAKDRRELLAQINNQTQTVQKFAKGTRSQPAISGASGGSSTRSELTIEDVDSLPSEEIKKRIAELKRVRR